MSDDDSIYSRFGKLLIIGYRVVINSSNRRIIYSNCKCDCGAEKWIIARNVKSGKTKSCGCMSIEKATRHGASSGGKRTPEYRSWSKMKERCLDKNHKFYSKYGGRGIKVCKRWMKFKNFFKDMGNRPNEFTLERRNNDGNYTPKNCRWATRKDQANNRSNSRMLEYRGKTKTLAEWAVELKFSRSMVHRRIKRGMSVADAFTKPSGQSK